MPRHARIKSADSIYHVMVRSVGNSPLFKCDDDKEFFLNLVKKYKEVFLFKIYAFCLMDTHAHLLIDSSGADISKFMHGINQCYAQHYNKKYDRVGHLFADRFKSKIVDNDAYLLTVSGYIHNNPIDMEKYEDKVYTYPYSSLGIYLGLWHDTRNIVDTSFVMSQFSSNETKAKVLYLKFVTKCTDTNIKIDTEFRDEKAEYRSERVIIARNYTPDQIVSFVSEYINKYPPTMHVKGSKKARQFRAVSVLLMRSLCNFSYKQISDFMGNITISQISRLNWEGINLVINDNNYKNIINEMIKTCRETSAV